MEFVTATWDTCRMKVGRESLQPKINFLFEFAEVWHLVVEDMLSKLYGEAVVQVAGFQSGTVFKPFWGVYVVCGGEASSLMCVNLYPLVWVRGVIDGGGVVV